jgi:UDP-N-acetylmuramoylalanine--D-glutamate ligase
VRSIYLIGEASDELAAALDAAGRSYSRDGDLERALAHASADAEPGDVVLLSPAAASFDQFGDFEQRGDAFRRLVEELA